MGSNFLLDWGGINQAFAAGKVGMYMGGSDVYNALVSRTRSSRDDYGLTVLPLRRAPTPACSAAARSPPSAPRPTDAEQDAAVKWIDFYYMAKLTDQDAAVADAEDARRRRRAGRHAGAADLRRGHAATSTTAWIKPTTSTSRSTR